MTSQELTDYIFIEDTNLEGDIAIVFGVNRFWRAAEKAIDLYNHSQVPKLLFTGGINRLITVHEGPAMALYAKDHGVPEADILIEDQATNTLENVLLSKALIEQEIGLEKIHTIVAVCMNLHARRALMTLRKHFPQHITLKVAPYDLLGFTRETWESHVKGNPRVHEEYSKIQEYLAKGDITEL